MRALAVVVVLAAAVGAPGAVFALAPDALDPTVAWRLRGLVLRGNRAVPAGVLRAAMVTKARPWFAPWQQRPGFDPAAFRADLGRLARLYRSRGYYHARLTAGVEVVGEDLVTATVTIDEGPPIVVTAVAVRIAGATLPARTQPALPLAAGAVLDEDAYARGEAMLRAAYREHGYARVGVTRWARVDVVADTAEVAYTVASGPACRFGTVTVAGTARVDPTVVRREVAFHPGTPFRESLLDRTSANLLGLGLFRTVKLEEAPGETATVDVRIHVTEAPPRDVRAGIGYDTEEEVRGLATWRHYDFLGGARQLGVAARASFIQRTIVADFLQPHFPSPGSRFRLVFLEEQEEEDAFTVDRSRLGPRVEWQPLAPLTTFASYRLEYESLAAATDAVRTALPGLAPPNVVLSGLAFGADWNATDDFLNPQRGWELNGTVEPVGQWLGGNVGFLRLTAEGRLYQPLLADFSVAARVRAGVADPLGRTAEIPLPERFFSGGLNSVRGYGRWRIGPLVDDRPIGGRALAETSVELHHPITDGLSGLVFVDGGQVSLRSFDVPFDALRYGVGFGVRYASPVGPLGVDLGFPVEPPDGDQRWQVHVTVGRAF
ncbi:MAG TPA: BamA/TamA family outer membrane protein [Candidatus Binatia bacterium]|nr:BamA/TamA family outer membrane protein [Candidatus Binatia bacterium]